MRTGERDGPARTSTSYKSEIIDKKWELTNYELNLPKEIKQIVKSFVVMLIKRELYKKQGCSAKRKE